MSSFNPDAWKQADVNDENVAPDPGTYEVSVQDAGAFTSKAGNDIVKAEYRVLSGPATGHTWTVISGFKSEGAIGVTKAMCSRLGVKIDDIGALEQLDSELQAVIGQYYEVEVKQNGEYRNTYVNGRITATTPASDVPSDTSDFEPAPIPDATADDDEKVPF